MVTRQGNSLLVGHIGHEFYVSLTFVFCVSRTPDFLDGGGGSHQPQRHL